MSTLAQQKQLPDPVVELSKYNFENLVDRLRFFNEVLTASSGNLRSVLRNYVSAGCKMFKCDSGFVGQRIGGVVRIVVSDSVLDSIFDGQLVQVTEPLVSNVLAESTQYVSENVTGAAFRPINIPYNGRVVQNVLAMPLRVYGEVFGLVCFFSTSNIPRNYSTEDRESIELMAKGVAKMIELQSAYKDQKTEKQDYATPGVKHFDDYLLQARLPEVYGVAGKVVEVLKKRVGQLPLGIGDIASELSLSKRTLQRRLQQQDLSYAEIRDKVRFHYSIDYLIEQNASIDSISSALDFSDRTSFTNAFKRWTGLSPSAFRKLFRDYA
ncbi:helix-turn-helix domain-containing protein [Halioxenophilus sp. WMMB6]|uniref:helix-turn-helix domain-containing protein n=1 Tax=Halioxenophilus sp. WMMB6 TaxID=3073815 RepID=UPI00295E3F2A|nr:helix-turn-helix domain-containing protein [Halioxenophilus sp. WMMB6]